MKIYDKEGILRFMNYSTIHDVLPVGNYHLRQDIMGFYLEKGKDFTFPKKIYGSVPEDVKFYSEAYRSTEKNLGIVLNGEKGSGKTLLATLLCKELGLPVIIITQRFAGGAFVKFIDDIQQPCVILLDEFDKVYAVDYEDSETGQSVNSQTD